MSDFASMKVADLKNELKAKVEEYFYVNHFFIFNV